MSHVPYLRNAWYVAAWAEEVGADQGLARTLLDEPIFFYRDSSGAVRALFDRCPHRFAPLSKGQVEGNTVACGYHGLAFGADGRCVRNPHGPITGALAVKAYPLVERHRAIWIWMGDPGEANPADIRDFDFLEAAKDTAFNNGYLHCQGHYQLFVDNILDLSHTDYLHPDTLGGGSITRSAAEVEEGGDGSITIAWRPKNEVPAPFLVPWLPAGTDRVDSWVELEWSAPAVIKLVTGAVPTGGSRDTGFNNINVHWLTPETRNSSHYFFASTRDYATDDADLNESVRRTRKAIFSTEDEPMIAAQQDRMGDADFWSLKPALLKIDRGPVMVRRRMDTMIAAEQAAG